MDLLYVCGSFRFAHEMKKLETRLKKARIECMVSREMDSRGIVGCLEKIEKADVIYVVDPEGYVGRSVSVDLGYAYAKNKPVYVMHPIDDPPMMNLMEGVLSFDELITFLTDASCPT